MFTSMLILFSYLNSSNWLNCSFQSDQIRITTLKESIANYVKTIEIIFRDIPRGKKPMEFFFF